MTEYWSRTQGQRQVLKDLINISIKEVIGYLMHLTIWKWYCELMEHLERISKRCTENKVIKEWRQFHVLKKNKKLYKKET